MDDASFGARLRSEREQRGVSLEDISSVTRISVRMLEAFEKEQWNRLPGGVFNRGFLRSIARYLSIDENALLAAYRAATNDSPDGPVVAAEPPPRRPSIVWISAAVLLLVAALAAAGYLAFGRSRPRSLGPVSRPAPSSATTTTPGR